MQCASRNQQRRHRHKNQADPDDLAPRRVCSQASPGALLDGGGSSQRDSQVGGVVAVVTPTNAILGTWRKGADT